MLKSLKIRFFECHRNSQFKFAPGLNVLVGPTDEGKSSALRAIRWVTDNRPIGDVKTHKQSKDARVELKVLCDADGKTDSIVRRKGTKTNAYALNGARFAAFGRGVPDAIVDVLAFDATLNYQKQSDPFFLIGLPNGFARGQFLSTFCDMSTAEASIKFGQHEVTRITGELVTARRIRDTKKLQSASRERLKGVRSDMEAVLWQAGEIANSQESTSQLEELVGEIHEIDDSLSNASTCLALSKDMNRASETVKGLLESQIAYDLLKTLLSAHREACKAIDEAANMPDLKRVEEMIRQMREAERETEEAGKIVLSIAVCRRRMAALGGEIQVIQRQLSTFKNCPLCGGTLK